MNHPNIVEFKDMRRKNNKYYLALEFIENGSLKDVLNKFGHFPESLAVRVVLTNSLLAYTLTGPSSST